MPAFLSGCPRRRQASAGPPARSQARRKARDDPESGDTGGRRTGPQGPCLVRRQADAGIGNGAAPVQPPAGAGDGGVIRHLHACARGRWLAQGWPRLAQPWRRPAAPPAHRPPRSRPGTSACREAALTSSSTPRAAASAPRVASGAPGTPAAPALFVRAAQTIALTVASRGSMPQCLSPKGHSSAIHCCCFASASGGRTCG